MRVTLRYPSLIIRVCRHIIGRLLSLLTSAHSFVVADRLSIFAPRFTRSRLMPGLNLLLGEAALARLDDAPLAKVIQVGLQAVFVQLRLCAPLAAYCGAVMVVLVLQLR